MTDRRQYAKATIFHDWMPLEHAAEYYPALLLSLQVTGFSETDALKALTVIFSHCPACYRTVHTPIWSEGVEYNCYCNCDD